MTNSIIYTKIRDVFNIVAALVAKGCMIALLVVFFAGSIANANFHRNMSQEVSIVTNSMHREAATISTDFNLTVAVKSDGTVLMVSGSHDFEYDEIQDWYDIVAVSVGGSYIGEHHVLGLRSDGTIVAVGSNEHGQIEVDDWYDIIQISAGGIHTVGLRVDGTVVAAGDNSAGQLNVNSWRNIVAVSAGGGYTVGLRSDGTVVAVGWDASGQVRRTRGWNDIVAISTSRHHTIGLRSDGTAVSTRQVSGFADVSNWRNITAVAVSDLNSFGLRYDGTVISTSSQFDLSSWSDIVAISAGENQVVGLRSDGTVVAAAFEDTWDYIEGSVRRIFNPDFERELPPELQISDWYDIKLP